MIVGGADNDVLTDGDGADLLAGRGVGDYLYAGDRGRRLDRDVLRGGPGADELGAPGGANILDGGPGDDLFRNANGDHFLRGGRAMTASRA